LTDQLLNNYTPSIASVTLIPSGGGRFEVMAGDTLVFSKKAVGRHAEPDEVARLLEEKLGITAQPVTKK
jgi:selenoprotein W-related protein